MESDRVARRRQSDVGVAPKRRTLVPRRARGLAVAEVRTVCGLCRRQQVEPRVLPCLHSFCTGCLVDLELSQAGHDSDQWSNEGSGDAAGGGKAEGGDGSSGSSGGGSILRSLSCPQCNATHPLPAGGVQGLPPDFVLQHRLLLASLVQEAARALCDLCSSDVPVRCAKVTEEVDKFMDAYVSALEEHRRALQRQVQEARAAKLQLLQAQETELERRAEEAATAVRFTEDLLAEASEVELLSLVATVLRRLEWCYSGLSSSGGLLEPRVSDCLQFLAEESPAPVKSFTLFGVITTQTVSPHHCTLNTDTLMNCRQHRKAEALMTTRDSDEQPLCHGGEKVTAELRYKDASHRKIPIQVNDRRDGTYLLTFVPDTPGNLNLSISVRGKPIKGSPFLICVRTLRPHHGTYHCCSFCSSNGSKEATCGCGGKMPGGYKGCGHGHAGHPGRRHWSCCGNILENSECGRANSNIYQFSL